MAVNLRNRLRHARGIVALSLLALGIAYAEEEAVVTASIHVAKAEVATMHETVSGFGTVEVPIDRMHAYSVAYQASVERVLVTPGQTVHKHDALMILHRTATSELEISHAQTDADFAEKELARLKNLLAQHLATNGEVALAQQAQQNAAAALTSARSRLGANTARTLAAETDGVIAAIAIGPGDVVGADTLLLKIAEGSELRVRVAIEPAELMHIAKDQSVEISLLRPGGETMTGKVEQALRQIDPQTRLAAAWIRINDAADLIPGSAVRARILTAARAVLSVPRSAVLPEGESAHVFVIAAGKAQEREVKTGIDDGQRIEIVDGLKAGEVIAISGNYELEDGMRVNIEADQP
ncbi:efflux RND transporter periplasmic adaptor subunit [Pseudolysobacter antarcticus]|uniref:Efflux RND transporter periplasmic adaptor subunit n=1 Tax=Pseudolysobacter antarcticus TaxID=2511995 RepID=A0A411HGD8_9GAMM|nr:efflux RND transporter periplasmic adaptor subunit [Pseudolysobacter antarcticus]QBB69553.1 efflux RND transporter periplasmic adaptor subunit [Pseudolysobacter antarcticus]